MLAGRYILKATPVAAAMLSLGLFAMADSLVVNPHKWLFTPIDLSAFYTRKPEVLRRAFSLVPEYLRTAEDPRADWRPQIGTLTRFVRFDRLEGARQPQSILSRLP